MAQINKPKEYFNTVIYTGNGAAARGITGVGFQPDWVWVKDRSVGYPHITWDSVRTNKASLCTNTTAAEVTTTARTLTSFDSDGFTTPNVTGDIFNDNGTAFVSWNWKAGGSASSNTAGSINSTVSANATSGFSIVKYVSNGTAGATVGHGLGVAPKMVITFNLAGEDNWGIGHSGLPSWDYYLQFNTSAQANSQNVWNDTAPSTSLVTLGDNGRSNSSNNRNYIMYCFAEKKGYSKFGSYTGNGSTNGTFVYTGFKPAFVIAKNTGVSANWVMFDNKRSGFNVDNDEMSPNTTGGDNDGQTYQYVDLLSNGFKWREASNNKNTSGDNFIYMAFAENPLVGTNNIPATAR